MSLVVDGIEPVDRGHDQDNETWAAGDVLLVPAPGRHADAAQHRHDARWVVPDRNGEITGPVQNFRWNMSPLVAFANISAIGKPVPIHTGEAYDGPGTGLSPAVRVEDFYMTSVSPAA